MTSLSRSHRSWFHFFETLKNIAGHQFVESNLFTFSPGESSMGIYKLHHFSGLTRRGARDTKWNIKMYQSGKEMWGCTAWYDMPVVTVAVAATFCCCCYPHPPPLALWLYHACTIYCRMHNALQIIKYRINIFFLCQSARLFVYILIWWLHFLRIIHNATLFFCCVFKTSINCNFYTISISMLWSNSWHIVYLLLCIWYDMCIVQCNAWRCHFY